MSLDPTLAEQLVAKGRPLDAVALCVADVARQLRRLNAQLTRLVAAPPDGKAPLLTGDEAAALLGVCRKTLYRMIHRGQLEPVVFSSRHVRYHREDVERLANGKL